VLVGVSVLVVMVHWQAAAKAAAKAAANEAAAVVL
jgi:hypothetical protein